MRTKAKGVSPALSAKRAAAGRKGGLKRSRAKTDAVRLNGLRGGRRATWEPFDFSTWKPWP